MTWQHDLEQRLAAPTSPRARPFVTAAFAISRDGCLSGRRGAATPISGPEALRATHQLRAMHHAVLVGIGTVLADDPQLTTRLVDGPSPLRVVVDSQLRTPLTARLLRSSTRAPWLVTTGRGVSQHARALAAAGAELVHVPASPEGVSLPALLSALSASGVNSLMLEGGAALIESFVRARCIDYFALTVSPQALQGPNAVALGPSTRAALRRFDAAQTCQLGPDRFDTGTIALAAGSGAPTRVAS